MKLLCLHISPKSYSRRDWKDGMSFQGLVISDVN